MTSTLTTAPMTFDTALGVLERLFVEQRPLALDLQQRHDLFVRVADVLLAVDATDSCMSRRCRDLVEAASRHDHRQVRRTIRCLRAGVSGHGAASLTGCGATEASTSR